MKRIIASLLLILYVGYASGTLLLSYNEYFPKICSSTAEVADCCSSETKHSPDKALLQKISAHLSSNLYSHTLAIGKTKLPSAFSCPVLTAKFTSSYLQIVSSVSNLKPAQPPLQLTPVFLQNCVLRL